MKYIHMLCALLVLAGCGTAPVPKPQIVEIPVAVGCLGARPARPQPAFGVGEYPGDKVAAQKALAEASAWEGYATKLEATMAGCNPKEPVSLQ